MWFVRNAANSRTVTDVAVNASSNVNDNNEDGWTINKSTLFRLSWNMLCASMCLYQLYHICSVYFAYPTAVNIVHPLRTHTEIPGITIRIQNSDSGPYLWQRSILKRKHRQLFEEYVNDFKKLGK